MHCACAICQQPSLSPGWGGRGASTTTVSVKSITLDGAPIYSFTVNES